MKQRREDAKNNEEPLIPKEPLVPINIAERAKQQRAENEKVTVPPTSPSKPLSPSPIMVVTNKDGLVPYVPEHAQQAARLPGTPSSSPAEAHPPLRTPRRSPARSPQERLKESVDEALDVLEEGLSGKDGSEKRRIAIEILDRAGVLKPKTAEDTHEVEADIKLAQAIANAFRGAAILTGVAYGQEGTMLKRTAGIAMEGGDE